MSVAIVWFREDLRLHDNPALAAAVADGHQILPLYIGSDKPSNSAADWWQHYALDDLRQQIEGLGGTFCLLSAASSAVLEQIDALVSACAVQAVYWNRRYTPDGIEQDKTIKAHLQSNGVEVRSFNGRLLREPWETLNKTELPYRVFTPFWRTCVRLGLPSSVSNAVENIQWFQADSLLLEDLQLLPSLDWDAEFYTHWQPTRAAGLALVQRFIDGPIEDYDADRDKPAVLGTTRLSPYLRSGLIGVREILDLVEFDAVTQERTAKQRAAFEHGREKLYAELGWREFSTYLLYHFPASLDQPLQARFLNFPWKKDPQLLQAWQKGRTGYPIVDAGMRELWRSGWMHNRVRMIVASFLVKHLMQPWQEGAAWFMDTLLDADIASNTQGWQWTAGCGVDAAPFFRVFNPVSQGKKFDSSGEYIRRWLPELEEVPDARIHEPWLMTALEQQAANCVIGEDYPEPIVDLKQGREAALAAWQEIKG